MISQKFHCFCKTFHFGTFLHLLFMQRHAVHCLKNAYKSHPSPASTNGSYEINALFVVFVIIPMNDAFGMVSLEE